MTAVEHDHNNDGVADHAGKATAEAKATHAEHDHDHKKDKKKSMGTGKGGENHVGQAAGLASARGSAAKIAYAASGVGVVIVAAIIIAAATRYGLKSDRAPGSDVEEGFPLNNPGVHPIYA